MPIVGPFRFRQQLPQPVNDFHVTLTGTGGTLSNPVPTEGPPPSSITATGDRVDMTWKEPVPPGAIIGFTINSKFPVTSAERPTWTLNGTDIGPALQLADQLLDAFTQAVERFTAVLPEIPRDPAAKISLATEGPRISRMLKVLLQEPRNDELLGEHLPLLNKAVARLNSVIDIVETDSLVGIADIPPLDDLYIFSRLREKPKEDLVRLFNLVVADPSALGARDRMVLHYALVELGVPVGLAIGPVGWVKLILVFLLVLLLIIGLFKPEIIPAITALAQVLAAIDAAGAAPPPPPPPPPSQTSQTAAQLKDIGDKNARLKEMLETLKSLKDAGLGTADLEGAIYEMQKKIRDEVRALDTSTPKPGYTMTKEYEIEECKRFHVYPWGTGEYHNWDISFGGITSTPPGTTGSREIEVEVDGKVLDRLTPHNPKTSVTGKECWLHLKGNPGDKAKVNVRQNW